MHLLADESITIQRPPAAVFEYVTNMERFGEWFPGVLGIASSNAMPHGQAGKEYLETVSVPLRGQRKIRIAVREAQANKRFVTEGKFPPLMPRMEVEFFPGGADACRVRWRMFSRNNSMLFKLLLLPLARRVMGKRAAAGMQRLKARLEKAGDGRQASVA